MLATVTDRLRSADRLGSSAGLQERGVCVRAAGPYMDVDSLCQHPSRRRSANGFTGTRLLLSSCEAPMRGPEGPREAMNWSAKSPPWPYWPRYLHAKSILQLGLAAEDDDAPGTPRDTSMPVTSPAENKHRSLKQRGLWSLTAGRRRRATNRETAVEEQAHCESPGSVAEVFHAREVRPLARKAGC